MSEVPSDIKEQKSSTPFAQRPPQEGSIGRNLAGVEIDLSSRRGKMKKALIERGHFIGSTRETDIPGTEINRGIVERYERGELFRAYMDFRREIKDAVKRGEDSSPIEERFNAFREQSTDFKKKLDILNRQFYPYPDDPNKWDTVHVEDGELGKHDIPVVTLDLHPPKDGKKDERVPYFIVPPYIANPYQVAFLAISLALEGQRVHIMTYPEKYKMSKSSLDWIERIREDKTLKLYSKLAQKTAEGLGLSEFNLVGASMGAAIALEMASDPNLKGKINDLIAIDPSSIFKRTTAGLLWDFGRDTVPPSFLDREISIKAAQSERPDLSVSMGRRGGWVEAPFLWAPILAKAQITPETLGRINAKGKFQVWIGGKSKITGERGKSVLTQGQQLRQQDPSLQPMKIIEVEGAHHLKLFSTLTMASIITQKTDPQEDFIVLKPNDLSSSGAQAILAGRYASR
jgi:hypothetical protein